MPRDAEDGDALRRYSAFAVLGVLYHHSDLDDFTRAWQSLRDGAVDAADVLQRQYEALDLPAISDWIRQRLDMDILLPADGEGLVQPFEGYEERRWARRAFTDSNSLSYPVFMLQTYSALIGADKVDAALAGDIPKPRRIPAEAVSRYRQDLTGRGRNPTLDELRDEIAAAATGSLQQMCDKSIYTLTAPTGAGKTLIGLDIALRLRQMNERLTGPIIYCLPFTSIIDQNHAVYQAVLKRARVDPASDVLLKHHYLAVEHYRTGREDKEYGHDESEVLVEAWNSDLVVTTFVQLFSAIFGNRNRMLKKFHKLNGAVVVLDEVQAIPHRYWSAVRDAVKELALITNTCFLLMTATRPLIFTGAEAAELLPESGTYFKKLSRTRIMPHLDEPCTPEALAERVANDVVRQGRQSALVILNTIGSSVQVYHRLKELLPDAIPVYLSTNITPSERTRRIREVRDDLPDQAKPFFVVTTQLVEAGVDIACAVVYRDFAPLDAVIQAAGRCNREAVSDMAEVHLHRLRSDNKDVAKYIYGNVLLDATQEVLRERADVPESEFPELADRYFAETRRRTADVNLTRRMCALEFRKIEEEFQLIEDSPRQDYFVIRDSTTAALWHRYQRIKDIKDFRTRRREWRQIKSDFLDHVVSPRVESAQQVGVLPLDVTTSGGRQFYDEETGYKEPENLVL